MMKFPSSSHFMKGAFTADTGGAKSGGKMSLPSAKVSRSTSGTSAYAVPGHKPCKTCGAMKKGM